MAASEGASEYSIIDKTEDKVLLQLDETYAIATKPSKNEPLPPTAAAMIPLESYSPAAPPHGVTRARSSLAPCYHVKFPRLEKEIWNEDWGLEDLKARTLREVGVGEMLNAKNQSHPNIAAYHGCTIAYGLITGICYSPYDETLQERLNPTCKSKYDFQYRDAERPLRSRENVIEGVRRGLVFLRSHGLVHNDIKPDNIMLSYDETPVIIDFDTYMPYGRSLKRVGRPVGWFDPRNWYALYSNDGDALAEVEMWMGDMRVKGYRFGNDVL